MADSKLIGVIGSAIGTDPYNRKSWSGSSYFFFSEMERQNLIRRAFGVDAPKIGKYLTTLANFHPNRQTWANRRGLDLNYRHLLTRELSHRISAEERSMDFLQVGGYFDTPSIVSGRCFAYYDGNLTSRVKSGYSLGVTDKAIARAVEYERELLSRMSEVFTFSEYLRQSFIEDYSLPPEKVCTVGGGINIETIPEFDPNKSYINKELLFIGVDFVRKGGATVLKAFKGVKKRFPDAVLHIVGPKTVEIPDDQSDGVICHGFVPKTDPRIYEIFSRASLFIMPSLFEPFGIAPLEAMVHQVPPIVTNQWAFKEMITSGVHGHLVEKEDSDQLESIIISSLLEPDKLREMGSAGRVKALSEYTWSRVVQNIGHRIRNA